MIGKRVKIKPVESVAAYLHGHTGTVESTRADREWDYKAQAGRDVTIFKIKLDVPAWCGAKGWPALETIGLKQDCFEEVRP